jgi:retron-type reverse transcriptase
MKRGVSGGLDSVPIENITLSNIRKLAEELREGNYKPHPTRRIYIPKSNGGRRPLGIANSKDKLVQQALRLVLEPIFEPTFANVSHGFRKGHSCHTALNQLNSQCKRPA